MAIAMRLQPTGCVGRDMGTGLRSTRSLSQSDALPPPSMAIPPIHPPNPGRTNRGGDEARETVMSCAAGNRRCRGELAGRAPSAGRVATCRFDRRSVTGREWGAGYRALKRPTTFGGRSATAAGMAEVQARPLALCTARQRDRSSAWRPPSPGSARVAGSTPAGCDMGTGLLNGVPAAPGARPWGQVLWKASSQARDATWGQVFWKALPQAREFEVAASSVSSGLSVVQRAEPVREEAGRRPNGDLGEPSLAGFQPAA
jgi:hypothetical protein